MLYQRMVPVPHPGWRSAGKYNLKFETTGQGNSLPQAEGYRWSQDNAGKSFSLTVLSTSEQQPAKLHDILISDEAEQIKTLNVIGTGMNAVGY